MKAFSTNSSISITHIDRICLVQIPKLLTLNQAVELKQQVQSICQMSTPPQQLILDFGHTTFIDSSGVGALIAILKVARLQQVELVCWSFSSQVKMMLSMTELDKVFREVKGTAAIAEEDQTTEDTSLAVHPSVHSKTKRLIDIVGGLVGIGITALLFVPIAIAIQLDNPGPILYKQVRCSWMGKRFRIWKFRSMVTNADAIKHLVENETSGPFFKNARDPRVTRVGRFLRKTSLDEFPQFWNVLIGDMSLVGTRPPTPEELENYELNHWQRLNVKPGLTGEWQVHGRSKVTNFEEVVQLDLQYQQNWSLMYDLKLILKTIVAIFSKNSGAV